MDSNNEIPHNNTLVQFNPTSDNEEQNENFYMDLGSEHTDLDSKLSVGTSFTLSEPLSENMIKSLSSSMIKIKLLSKAEKVLKPERVLKPVETKVLRSSTQIIYSPISATQDNDHYIDKPSDLDHLEEISKDNLNNTKMENSTDLLEAEFNEIMKDVINI